MNQITYELAHLLHGMNNILYASASSRPSHGNSLRLVILMMRNNFSQLIRVESLIFFGYVFTVKNCQCWIFASCDCYS